VYRVLALLGLTNFSAKIATLQAQWVAFQANVNATVAGYTTDGVVIKEYTAFDPSTGTSTSTTLTDHAIIGRAKTADVTSPLLDLRIGKGATSSAVLNTVAINVSGVVPFPYVYGNSAPSVYGIYCPLLTGALGSLGASGYDLRISAGLYNSGMYSEGTAVPGAPMLSYFSTDQEPKRPGAMGGCAVSYDSGSGGPAGSFYFVESVPYYFRIKVVKAGHSLRTGYIVRLGSMSADFLAQMPFKTTFENSFYVMVQDSSTFYLAPVGISLANLLGAISSFTSFTSIIITRRGLTCNLDQYGALGSYPRLWADVTREYPITTVGALYADGSGGSAVVGSLNMLAALDDDAPSGRGRYDWDGFGYRAATMGANAAAVVLPSGSAQTAPIVAAFDRSTITFHYIRAYRTLRFSCPVAVTSWSGNVLPDSYDGHELTLYNAGTTSVLLPHGAGFNLRLDSGASITLPAMGSVKLTFLSSVGDWVQTGTVLRPI
jgi:hypothetical protein